MKIKLLTSTVCLSILISGSALAKAPHPVPDTKQNLCYNNTTQIDCPTLGTNFYGQDAQHNSVQPNYTDNKDGTITDNITGLMWVKSPDLNGDRKINIKDKLSYKEAAKQAKTFTYAGHKDWRLPTIKEMYSLMDFRGVDPSGYKKEDKSGLIPFIDRTYFDFDWGDTDAGERIIDSQMASSTLYIPGTGPRNEGTMFGVNFADGRIKGYGLKLHNRDKLFYVMYVRGKSGYGINDFKDNGNQTISDLSTGLMWSKGDSQTGMNWKQALKWVQAKNEERYLGHSDWRLPNVKELQILVDYDRAPNTTKSAAISPVFNTTEITNEGGEKDFPFYWSSTTHSNWTKTSGNAGAYVSFGRAMGFMPEEMNPTMVWSDVHGAGAQRSDPKTGNASDYPKGNGPQGDAIRVQNYVRLVRDIK